MAIVVVAEMIVLHVVDQRSDRLAIHLHHRRCRCRLSVAGGGGGARGGPGLTSTPLSLERGIISN